MAALIGSLAKKDTGLNDLIARSDLLSRLSNPIRFSPPTGGTAYGYEATILPDICRVLIEAGRLGKLQAQQAKLSEQCAILQHGFATVGIIALVDEATGYQDFRQRDALAVILEKFVAKELRPWVRTFPPEFYRELYRLNGWTYDDKNSARPGVVGHWTNNIVYERLAPGVLVELRKVTPRDERGRLKSKLFQRLTDDVGHPKLREHLAGVIMIMKYSHSREVFKDRLDREYPQWGQNLRLPFPDEAEAGASGSREAD
jgi:hypothetical protein